LPRIAEKAQAPNGKGVIFSYKTEPNKFYYRELIAGTKRYRYKLIANAITLNDALDKCVETYIELQKNKERYKPDCLSSTKSYEKKKKNGLSNKVVPNRSIQQKAKELENCIDDFLAEQRKKVDCGVLAERTYLNKKQILKKQMTPYLESIGVYSTNQLNNNTFKGYLNWRVAAISTKRLEVGIIKDFILNYCAINSLLARDIDTKYMMPIIKNSVIEDQGNSPLIDKSSWSGVVEELKKLKEESKGCANHRGEYFNLLFYRWCLLAVETGLRPNVELNRLRWCDIYRVEVACNPDHAGNNEQKWIARIDSRKDNLSKQRTVYSLGGDDTVRLWRDEQQNYIDKYCPKIRITEKSLVFGNPYREMSRYSYSRFTRQWHLMIERLKDKQKSYAWNNTNFTLFSLRSTYIFNSLLAGNDICTTAKYAGISVAYCEKYYNRVQDYKKSKHIAEEEACKVGLTNKQPKSYLGIDYAAFD